jgi:hypothetical protein
MIESGEKDADKNSIILRVDGLLKRRSAASGEAKKATLITHRFL